MDDERGAAHAIPCGRAERKFAGAELGDSALCGLGTPARNQRMRGGELDREHDQRGDAGARLEYDGDRADLGRLRRVLRSRRSAAGGYVWIGAARAVDRDLAVRQAKIHFTHDVRIFVVFENGGGTLLASAADR